jgi:hypothetical protein
MYCSFCIVWGRGSVVVIENRQGVDGPVFETREARDFLYTCPDRPTQPPVQRVPRFFAGVKQWGNSDDHPI